MKDVFYVCNSFEYFFRQLNVFFAHFINCCVALYVFDTVAVSSLFY